MSDENRTALPLHKAEYVFNAGWDDEPDWKVICECGWECWDQPTEDEARRKHELHAHLAWDYANALVPDE